MTGSPRKSGKAMISNPGKSDKAMTGSPWKSDKAMTGNTRDSDKAMTGSPRKSGKAMTGNPGKSGKAMTGSPGKSDKAMTGRPGKSGYTLVYDRCRLNLSHDNVDITGERNSRLVLRQMRRIEKEKKISHNLLLRFCITIQTDRYIPVKDYMLQHVFLHQGMTQ